MVYPDLREDGSVDSVPQEQLFKDHPNAPLLLLQDHDADTLVFFGAPPKQVDQSWQDCKTMQHCWNTFNRMHSDNLRALDSPFFEKLLGPTAQFRTERRWRKQNILLGNKPDGIKYFLDLSPPREGDDAVLLLTQLTCTLGILTWSRAKTKFDIPSRLIAGQDDFTEEARLRFVISPRKRTKSLNKRQLPPDTALIVDTKKPRIGNWEGVMPKPPPEKRKDELPDSLPDASTDAKLGDYNMAGWSDPQDRKQEIVEPKGKGMRFDASTDDDDPAPEEPFLPHQYSQIRHWSAIERLIHAIEGQDPMLDSAPKVWSFFAVADYFGCAKHPKISGWLMAWLFGAPNWNFIQCNPEVCYRIGLGIRSHDLIRAAFSLLVGEKVLSYSRRDEYSRTGKPFNPNFSIAGRRLDFLDEDEQTRIDHAAVVFRDRVRALYDDLVGREMSWLHRCSWFRRLTSYSPRSREETALTDQLIRRIKDFVRSRILYVLSSYHCGDVPGLDCHPETYQQFYPSAKHPLDQYDELSEEERIFSRCFWLFLRASKFTVGNSMDARDHGLAQKATISYLRAARWTKLTSAIHDEPGQWRLLMVLRPKLFELSEDFHRSIRLPVRLHKSSITGQSHEVNDSFDLPYRVGKDCPDNSNSVQIEGPSMDGTTDKQTDQEPHNITLPIRNALTVNHTASTPDADPKSFPWDDKDTDAAADRNQGSGQVQDVPDEDSEFSPWDDKAPYREVNQNQGYGQLQDVPDARTSYSQYTFMYYLLVEVEVEVRRICDGMLATPQFGEGEALPTTLIPHIMCMSDAEWKYLELWAGGNDDKTGGVFNDRDVPALEHGGFEGGTRGLSDTPESSDGLESSWSEMMSTVGRISHRANQGTATDTMTFQSVRTDEFDVRSVNDASSSTDTAIIDRDDSSFASVDSEETDHLATDEDEDSESGANEDNDNDDFADGYDEGDWDLLSEEDE